MNTLKLLKNVLGSIIIFIGLFITVNMSLWAITGNHGATWVQMFPAILIGIGLIVIGVIVIKVKERETSKEETID